MDANFLRAAAITASLTIGWLGATRTTWAHCDTMDGPVVAAAKAALAKGDVTPLLKWVKADDEAAIKEAFARTLVVREKGPEAKELADMYFFETLVRIHRAGEGAPYTGLKPAGTPAEPAVAAADEALEKGNADQAVKLATDAAAAGIRQRFAKAAEARKHADETVEAGRKFVTAYVEFVHYVEGLVQMAGGPAAHHESAQPTHPHEAAKPEAPPAYHHAPAATQPSHESEAAHHGHGQ